MSRVIASLLLLLVVYVFSYAPLRCAQYQSRLPFNVTQSEVYLPLRHLDRAGILGPLYDHWKIVWRVHWPDCRCFSTIEICAILNYPAAMANIERHSTEQNEEGSVPVGAATALAN